MFLKTRKMLENYRDKFSRFRSNKKFSGDLSMYLNSEDVLTEDYRKKINNYWDKYKSIDTDYHNLYIYI